MKKPAFAFAMTRMARKKAGLRIIWATRPGRIVGDVIARGWQVLSNLSPLILFPSRFRVHLWSPPVKSLLTEFGEPALRGAPDSFGVAQAAAHRLCKAY